MIWKERGVKMKKTQKPRKNRKTGAVIVILLGLLCAVSTVRSCGTKRVAIQGKVDDVVYVGQGSYDPANDGKIVIVCGELKVLEPAYDDELGLTIYAPRAMRSAKKMKLKKWNLPATEENMEWNPDLGVVEWKSSRAQQSVEIIICPRNLSNSLCWEENTNLMRRRYRRQDLRFLQTGNTAVKNLSEPSEWAEKSLRRAIGVINILFRIRAMGYVTVIGIQEQGTLTYVKGATPNMLSGETG